MRHQVDHRKLGRHTSHRRALLRNLATSLILSERIETTLPKAKELRRLADELITWGKIGTLHARRQAAQTIQNPEALRKLFDGNGGLAARFTDRQGGYTRVYKFGFRRGDSAEMAAIEYLGYQLPAPKLKEERKKSAGGGEKKKEEKKPVKKAAEKKEKSAGKEPKKEGRWGLFGRRKST